MMHHFLYRTENLVNHKYYVGVHTTDDLNDGYLGSGKLLLKAIKKHGRENFKRTIMKFAHSREHAFEMEAVVVTERFVKSPKTYNIDLGGKGSVKPGGVSDETRKKLSEANRGEKNPFHGKTHSEETRKKISEAAKGKIPSEETRKKMSEARKGKPRSEETRKKISEAQKGRILTEDHRKKLSEARKGKTHSEETRKKLSEANKGKVLSEETRKKMSEKGESGIIGVHLVRRTKINAAGEEYLYERWQGCRENRKSKNFPFTDEGKQQAAAWVAAEGDA